jgi:hypothetical protein
VTAVPERTGAYDVKGDAGDPKLVVWGRRDEKQPG